MRATKRQMECLAFSLVLGNREAAERLGISEQTVKNNIGALLRGVGAENRAQAAIRLGWLRIPARYDVDLKQRNRRHADR